MLHKLTIENICTIEHDVIDFTNKNFILIVGGSGSGKSTIIGSIFACLYGSFPDKPTQSLYEDVYNKSEPALISLELELNGDMYTISRSIDAENNRSAAYVYRGSKKIEGPNNNAVKNWIEDNVADKDIFLSIYYESQQSKHDICSVKPSEATEILIRLLNVGRLEVLYEKFRKILSTKKTEMTAIDRDILEIAKASEEVPEQTAKLTELSNRFKTVKDEISKLKDSLEDNTHDQYLNKKQQLEGELSNIKKLIKNTSTSLSSIEQSITVFEKMISDKQTAGCKTSDGFEYPKCPLLDVESTLKALEEKKREKGKVEEELQNLKKQQKTFIEALEVNEQEKPKRSSDVAKQKQQLAALESEKDSINKDIGYIQSTLENLLNTVSSEGEVLKSKASVKKEIDFSSFLKDAFSKTGVQNMLLTNSLAEINNIANKICSAHEIPLTFVMKAFKERKTGDASPSLNIALKDTNGLTRHVSSFSGGERQIIQLVLRFAVQEFLFVNFGVEKLDLFIGDEIWSEMDSDFIHKAFELIKRRSAFSQVIIVSHNHTLTSSFDNVINVNRIGEFSQISAI